MVQTGSAGPNSKQRRSSPRYESAVDSQLRIGREGGGSAPPSDWVSRRRHPFAERCHLLGQLEHQLCGPSRSEKRPSRLPVVASDPLHINGYPPAGYLGWRRLPITGVGGIDAFPVSFSEPERHRFVPESSCSQNAYFPTQQCQDNYPTSSFIYAATQAKANGLASWTWHTEKLFRLASNYSPGLSQVEDLFLQQIGPALAGTAWPR